jgi:arylsulfatase A-like enzyme
VKVIPRAFSNAGYITMGTGKLMHSSGAANRLMFEQHFDVEQRWSPFTREQVRYTEHELESKGTNNPRHVVPIDGCEPIVLPLNRMPSDRRPDTPEGESFDWGPLDVPDSAMGDAQIVDWAIEKLNADYDKPFFLGVGFYRPHIPLWAPREYFLRFQEEKIELPPFLESDLDDLSPTGRRWALAAITAGLHSTVVEHDQWENAIKAYLACTTFVDAQIARLLDALDRGRYGSNTVIVLWSDHGWHLGEKQHWGKWTGWERSTRVPLVIVPPKDRAATYKYLGRTCDEPVGLIDVYPTLVDLCQVPAPASLDGQSLVPLMRDPSLRTGRTVLTSFDLGNVALRSSRWRYIRYADGAEELYDVVSDPNEWINLSNKSSQRSILEGFRNSIPKQAIEHTSFDGSDEKG